MNSSSPSSRRSIPTPTPRSSWPPSKEGVEIEEGYIYYTGLPGTAAARLRQVPPAGGRPQSLARVTRCRRPSTRWSTSDSSATKGSRGVGLSLYTTLPFSLAGGTHEVWLQGTTVESDPLLGADRSLLFLGRLQNFWQLSRSTYAQVGVTGFGGDNDDDDLRSRVVGLDFRMTYRPAGGRHPARHHLPGRGVSAPRHRARRDHQSVRRVPGSVRRAPAAAGSSARGTITSRRREGSDDTEWRITPNITWWQSEFVYLRLEGEHRNSELEGSRNMLTLQAVWAMGPHKHETY